MRPATQKSGSGPIGVVGPVLALLLTALGIVLLREALVTTGAVAGTRWLPAAAEGLRGFAPAWWLIPAGVVVALIGLWLLVTAVRPRSRRTLPLTSQTGIFLHTRDVARLASGAAGDIDGVLQASSSATRRKVSVSVHATTDQGLREAVTEAVTHSLAPLRTPPRVAVTVHSPRQKLSRGDDR
ncbi:DUF6286 domain-containing protein [Kineococcus sp. SYSU DK003]|uniref:DUF6286 domain-containing protein n=1 Tax=Kineococcus sp. SYSU DK003 TaxID=3383124 RepID=UPI003D7EF408